MIVDKQNDCLLMDFLCFSMSHFLLRLIRWNFKYCDQIRVLVTKSARAPDQIYDRYSLQGILTKIIILLTNKSVITLHLGSQSKSFAHCHDVDYVDLFS